MPITPGSINGEESATVTFKVRTVTVDMNSTSVHQEVMTIGDPESTLGLVRVRAATPNSTDFGMVVRTAGSVVIEGNSTVVQGTSPWVVTGNSTIVAFGAGLISSGVLAGNSSALNVRSVWSSTHADQPVQATQSGTWNVGTVTAVTGITNPVTIQGNSSVVQSGAWNVSLIGPQSSAAPAGNSSAIVVRIAGGPSSAADLLMRPVFSSTNTDNPVRAVLSSTAADNPVSLPALAVAATVTSVNDAATNQTLLSLNAARKGFILFNDSTQIAYVKLGTTATTADYSYQIPPNGFYESVGVGVYTGRIDCIWAADGTGAMKITELA
jgi:hypothetical protein